MVALVANTWKRSRGKGIGATVGGGVNPGGGGVIDVADGGVICAAGGCPFRKRPPQNKSADATELTIRVEEVFFMVIGDRVALRNSMAG